MVVVLAILSGIAFWRVLPRLLQGGSISQTNLIVWGFDEEETVKPQLILYQQNNPGVNITYVKQSLLNYVPRVQTQISAMPKVMSAPDIFLFHSSFWPAFLPLLQEVPDAVTVLPIVSQTLTADKKIYGLPKEVSGLAMFYNIDILKGAGVGVPRSWSEFTETAKAVTVKDSEGKIQTAGAALGTTENVSFWPEILSLLFLQQPGADLSSPSTSAGADVLKFYTSFVLDPQKKVWDTTLPSSSEMFAQGRLAFYFAPRSEVQVLNETAPGLNFATAVVPQLSGRVITQGGVWVWGVSKTTQHSAEAWDLAKFLSSGNPPDLKDPKLSSFALQGPYYKGWYLNSGVGWINDEMIKNYAGAVNGVLQGKDALSSLQVTQASIKETLKTYGVAK